MYLSEVEGKGGVRARAVTASVANDIPLTTLELKYPRFIHSELMTHRMFSRNAASSRAIPVKKMIEQVENDPAMPIHWGKNQPGMVADEEQSRLVYVPDYAAGDYWALLPNEAWRHAADVAVEVAKSYQDAGYHKQIVNRLLEPFQFMHTVVTATEWNNFFNLRLHKDAQPEIYELARVMQQAMEEAEYTELEHGQWHLPYLTDRDEIFHKFGDEWIVAAIKSSVARCARVSYLNHDNTQPDLEKDVALHDMLLEAGHMSPFEHVATRFNELDPEEWGIYSKGCTHIDRKMQRWSSNFRGWVQYRNLVGDA